MRALTATFFCDLSGMIPAVLHRGHARDARLDVRLVSLIRLTGLGPRKCAMTHKRGGLLAQIEADVANNRVPLSSLLQKCIVLGGQARSDQMRDWARQELNGYAGVDTVPEYRHVPAAVMAVITNMAGYNAVPRRLDVSVFDPRIRDVIRETVGDLEDAILGAGIGELEALAGQGTDMHRLVPPWSGVMADTLSKYHMTAGSRVAEVYWAVPNTSILGILSRVRTALAELVGELITLTPQDQEVPDKLAADQVAQFIITGDRSVINYSLQHAAGGGTNVTVTGAAPGPVTVSGAHGTAIGSQTASGANSSVAGTQTASGAGSSVVGGQAVQAGRDAVTAGRDAAIPVADGQPAKGGWWARLRKRGAVVAFSTIIGAIAAVAGVVVAILIAAGWKP